MKGLFLGSVFFVSGILGLGFTHITFACANWSTFSAYLNSKDMGIMYYYILSWILLVMGAGVLIYEMCIRKDK